MKKEIHSNAERLASPEVRLKMLSGWLRNTKVTELIEAAKMLEFESTYILERLKSSEIK